MKLMKCYIYTPSDVIYEGEVSSLRIPLFDGYIGVLYGHSPMVATIGEGKLIMKTQEGEKTFELFGGYAHIIFDKVYIMANEIKK